MATREVLTAQQVAEYLQLDLTTIYRYVRQGKLPALEVRRQYRIPRESVDLLLMPTTMPRGLQPRRYSRREIEGFLKEDEVDEEIREKAREALFGRVSEIAQRNKDIPFERVERDVAEGRRARGGLADCLWILGERDGAIEHYREMLQLNPNDNQGIRYKLLSCLIESKDIKAAEGLLREFEGDILAFWLYSWALVAFIRQGDSREARERLQEAVKHNPHVIAYLLGRRRLPGTISDHIGMGNSDEAVTYVAELAGHWLETPGALEWVASRGPGPVHTGSKGNNRRVRECEGPIRSVPQHRNTPKN